MINLLPTEKKAEIKAARTNLILVRYITILLFSTIFILAAMYFTYSVLAMTKTSSEQVIASNDLQADVYSSTKSQVDALSASLAQTKLLLNQEVRYSKVFINIAQLMPPGTVFGKLALDTNSIGGTPITTKIYAKTSADVVTLRQNFEQSPMFSGVNFQSITESGSNITGYPVSADITFTLTKRVTQ
jgi:Tfp pilus assembly protein PilN